MNADLTIDTLVFKTIYSDKSGSLRRETSRGANLPTELSIATQDYVDSGTKMPGKRTVVRFTRFVAASDGRIVPGVSAYTVVPVLSDALITATDINAVTGHLINMLGVAANTNGLGLNDEVFVNKEQ